MALQTSGVPSTCNTQQAAVPMAELSPTQGQLQAASLGSPDPRVIAAAGRSKGPPFQLPWAQVLPRIACQPRCPQASLGQAVPGSHLPGWGAASAAGSWRRKQDPRANGQQSPALDETLDPGSGLAGGGETAAAPLPTLAAELGTMGQGGGNASSGEHVPGLEPPKPVFPGVLGLLGGSAEPLTHFYLVSQG